MTRSNPRRTARITDELSRAQLGRLGNTPYQLAGVSLEIEGSPFAPASLLNHLRRQAVELLEARQSEPRAITISEPSAALAKLTAPATLAPRRTRRTAAPSAGPHARATRRRARPFAPPASRSIISTSTACAPRSTASRPPVSRLASPALASSSPAKNASPISCSTATARSWSVPPACLKRCVHQPHPRLTGDFSLNAANAITARELLASRSRPHRAHARSERRADRRTRARAPARIRSKPSSTSTCPCFTPSTASSAAFFRPAPAIAIAAVPASSIASSYAIRTAAPIP